MEQKITMMDLWTLAKRQNKPLLGELNFDFLEEYNVNFAAIDRYFGRHKGKFCYLFPNETVAETLSDFREDMESFFTTRKENFNRIWAVNNEQYDPLENYNGSSTITESRGQKGRTENLGEIHSSTSTTAQDSYTEGSRNGLGSTDYEKTDKTNIHNGPLSSNVSSDAHVNNFTEDAYTDTITESKAGNLGVTTSQQMFQSEVDLWTDFNFYETIFNEIIKKYFYFYDEGINCL